MFEIALLKIMVILAILIMFLMGIFYGIVMESSNKEAKNKMIRGLYILVSYVLLFVLFVAIGYV